jgi:hypothetical protein
LELKKPLGIYMEACRKLSGPGSGLQGTQAGRQRRKSSHLFRRADSQHGEPRSKNRHHALDEGEARQCQIRIILDNEA